MALRFRKRIKIMPGLYLNLGKTGISTSIGGKGLTVNLRGDKTRTTVGIPGTGISYSSTSTASDTGPADVEPRAAGGGVPLWLIVAAVVLLIYFMT